MGISPPRPLLKSCPESPHPGRLAPAPLTLTSTPCQVHPLGLLPNDSSRPRVASNSDDRGCSPGGQLRPSPRGCVLGLGGTRLWVQVGRVWGSRQWMSQPSCVLPHPPAGQGAGVAEARTPDSKWQHARPPGSDTAGHHFCPTLSIRASHDTIFVGSRNGLYSGRGGPMARIQVGGPPWSFLQTGFHPRPHVSATAPLPRRAEEALLSPLHS